MNIRVQGNIIQVIRYKVKYTEFETEMTMSACTLEEANEIATRMNGTVEALDTTGIEWIDGVEIPESKYPMEEALKILEMGEQGYSDFLVMQEKMKLENLLAENESLKQQLLETQLALVDIYESTLKG